ncbi:hypothetical protein [Clostridium sp. 'White wine YQ']|uniref:hypothetical protein n=1 Tax=Clostridium sp. 'White wine YQ' TaxID=3027474 RepID=UPI0023658E4D|nr:hypothetical protein [Clostridium sp. 'White wine YQ']MDD7793710.1 hypothetical protein [Clostridium sp. 'White wine YQ']
MEELWFKGNTLGSKEKLFMWSYNGDELRIKKEQIDGKELNYTFSNFELEKIIKYIESRNKVALANNVEKLSNKTEKEGIGSFIYNNLKSDTGIAQSSSQLVSIFYMTSIISYNGKKKDMEFWIKDSNWRECLRNYVKNQTK